VLNWSDKVNILDLLEGGVCLAEMAPTEQNWMWLGFSQQWAPWTQIAMVIKAVLYFKE
jgi:hypothetical protein